ncbi:DegT/DnrJ/EryC1/StrS family aminotransferase [bacterium]|nr:DegT/DnrJ/EryC1/StrS family aminotransferase [bacterium]
MSLSPIPITRPWMGEEEVAACRDPILSGWMSQGPKVAEFERRFADYVGVPHAVAVTSCTTGLHLALIAAGVGPGDEVLVPSFTWVATANAVLYVNATPVLCDISLESFNLDPADAEARITERTRAILPVHLFGLPAPMDEIHALADKYNLKIVEDAACSLGGVYRGTHTGAWGHPAAFSLHPRKSITVGEGGMVTTHSEEQYVLLQMLRSHGAAVSDLERHSKGEGGLPSFGVLGYNYRMTDLQAAVGLVQMQRLPEIMARRQARARRYDQAFGDLPHLATPKVPEGCVHGYQSYVCLLSEDAPIGRDALMRELSADGIATRPGTHAVHMLDYYRKRFGYRTEDLPASAAAAERSLAIPLFPTMTDEEQERVIAAMRARLGG